MPDWQQLVRERLGALGLDASTEQEIIKELADHLRDRFDSLQKNGLTETKALNSALAGENDWIRLARRIQQEKQGREIMSEHIRTIGGPGIVALAITLSLGPLLRGLGYEPHFIRMGPDYPQLLLFDPLMLLGFIGAGALAAYWSGHLGGGRMARMLAALFPSIFVLAITGILFVAAKVFDAGVFPYSINSPLVFILMNHSFFSLALLTGALPFLKLQEKTLQA